MRTISAFLKALTIHFFEEWKCPFCGLRISRDSTFADHHSDVHLSISLGDLNALLAVGSEEAFLYQCQAQDALWSIKQKVHNRYPVFLTCVCLRLYPSDGHLNFELELHVVISQL